jgi:hypothetical protein
MRTRDTSCAALRGVQKPAMDGRFLNARGRGSGMENQRLRTELSRRATPDRRGCWENVSFPERMLIYSVSMIQAADDVSIRSSCRGIRKYAVQGLRSRPSVPAEHCPTIPGS